MAQLFLQICNFTANLVKFIQIQFYRSQVNILYTFNGLGELAP